MGKSKLKRFRRKAKDTDFCITTLSQQTEPPAPEVPDHADFDDASELIGAIEEAKAHPSALGAKLAADVAAFAGRLPQWRRDQLNRHGYRGDGPPKFRVLIELCLNLASIKAGGAFTLSYREAAEAVGTSQTYAWTWLRLLEACAVLVCVQRGNWQRKLASVYRFADSVDVAGVSGDGPPF